MQIQGTGPAVISGAASGVTGGKNMGREEFLKLLVAQLSNQDPLNPMENEEFVAQLAQFSSLEQLMGIGQGMDELAALQQGSQSTQVAAFIGKEVTAVGDRVTVPGHGEQGDLGFRLAGRADEIQVQILDEHGAVIATGEVRGQWDSGIHQVDWGQVVWKGAEPSPGEHRIRLVASSNGSEVGVDALVRGRVTGVSFENGYPELLVGDRRINLGDVLSLGEV